MQQLAPEEQAFVLEVENEWTRMGEARGEAKGEARGQARAVTRQLRRRFGDLPVELADAIARLTPERLDALTDAVLDFATLAEGQAWVAGAS